MSQNKPGYKTTEFYLSMLATLVGLFLAAGIFPETHWSVRVAGLLATGLASMGYASNRASVKVAQIDAAASTKPPAPSVPDVPKGL